MMRRRGFGKNRKGGKSGENGADDSDPFDRFWDVLVIGAGNAGVCAAIAAAEAGCRTLVMEAAPKHMRGGNTRHTRNLRVMRETESAKGEGAGYPFAEYYEDLMQVTQGAADPKLARLTIEKSAGLPKWLEARGVRFQSALKGTLNLDRTNAFFLGGGRAMLNHLCAHAESLGVRFAYESAVSSFEMEGGECKSVKSECGRDVRAGQIIAAAGGFQANRDWLAQGWGDAARNFLVRGTPYNRGIVLKSLLAAGAQSIGSLDQCHAVAIDARAPDYDGGIVTRIDAVPFGIALNARGERFYDEGEDFWPKRYALWGRLLAQQPEQTGYALVDSAGIGRCMPGAFAPISDATISGLARRLGLDPDKTAQTVNAFNAACPTGAIDPQILDGQATNGLDPEKTNWAAPLSEPPFYGFPLKPGITFTYMGVKVNENAEILMEDETPAANLYAAGEMMAGNILARGYLAGIGMTIGSVFGAIAGARAAQKEADYGNR